MGIGIGLVRVARRVHHHAPGGELPPFELYIPEVDLPVDDERYPYLRLIDPYDETILSSHQCGIVEVDFQRLAADRPGSDTLDLLQLVRRCAGDVSTELWFVGD